MGGVPCASFKLNTVMIIRCSMAPSHSIYIHTPTVLLDRVQFVGCHTFMHGQAFELIETLWCLSQRWDARLLGTKTMSEHACNMSFAKQITFREYAK